MRKYGYRIQQYRQTSGIDVVMWSKHEETEQPSLAHAMSEAALNSNVQYSWLQWTQRRIGVYYKIGVFAHNIEVVTLWDLETIAAKYNKPADWYTWWGLPHHDEPEKGELAAAVVKGLTRYNPDYYKEIFK